MAPSRFEFAPGWSMWNTAVLRGAGFPATWVLRIAQSDTAPLDALLVARRELETAREAAIEALHETQRSKAVNKARARLERGELPTSPDKLGSATESVEQVIAASQRVAALEEQARAAHEIDAVSSAEALKDIARDPRFREAVLWQNRAALHGSIASYLRRKPGRADAKTRQQERLLAFYLQRYCVKNDTIGFFGPVGWATLGTDETSLEPDDRLTERVVVFERWAIDAVADALSSDPTLLGALAPRLLPTVLLEKDAVRLPDGRVAALPAPFMSVLSRCDGETSASDIAAASVDLDTDDVFAILEQLASKGLIIWELDLPSELPTPAAALASTLERLGDAGKKGREALAELEGLRQDVASAAGDHEALDAALSRLGEAFEKITGQAAQRQKSAARALVYEDTVRGGSVDISKDAMKGCSAALALVLDSARWFTHEIATRYRAVLGDEHTALAAEGDGTVRYIDFWRRVEPHFATSQQQAPPIVEAVSAELTSRWHELLDIEAATVGAPLRRTSIELGEKAAELFAAPGPGWPGAIHVSPDLMFASADEPSAESLAVLGEVHLECTMLARCLVERHPNPDKVWRLRDEDIGQPRITPVQARAFEARTDAVSRSARDLHLELGRSRSWRPRDHVLTASALTVERDDAGHLVVVCKQSGRRIDVIAFLEQYLRFSSSSHFRLLRAGAHMPRILIDNLVVGREQWRVERDDFPDLDGDRITNLWRALEWSESRQIPRWVFVKVPQEPKPVFIDFRSPISIEILANQLREAQWLVLSEMLPGFEALWLGDQSRTKFTSELRLTLVDHCEWATPT